MIINIQLDFRSGQPITNQLVEQIQGLIAAGVLGPGDQLPTVRALASELRVNFNTVARAYRILDEIGIISTQQGRGTYILDRPPPESTQSMLAEALVSLTHRYVTDALRLGVSPDDLLSHLIDNLNQWKESENAQ